MKEEGTRPYVMRSRAEAKAETGRRILVAVRELAEEQLNLDPTLEAVAGRAGVSVQTLLRHFGSRDGLFDAAVDASVAATRQERETPVGDVPAAVRVIVEHYERQGDFVLHLLGHERDDERVARAVGPGRGLHRQWVEQVFAPLLPRRGTARTELVDLLVVATDLYTWKLLRRDRGLSRGTTEARMRHLVDAVLAGGGR